MRLIYLSPVPWLSFAQRPHKFVEWYHGRSDSEVLWVDPYPTRFPCLKDICRPALNPNIVVVRQPSWLRVIRPGAVAVEPLPGSELLNERIWKKLFLILDDFVRGCPGVVTIGKPSALALSVLKRTRPWQSIYDAMDDFSAFYSGLSRLAMRRRELRLVRQADTMLVSSTELLKRWSAVRSDVQLVHNGLDASAIPPRKASPRPRVRRVFGYIGTIGAWFDWRWVIKLARQRPNDVVRLIGPVHNPPPRQLPANVELLSPCNHAEALQAMRDFDVGLIPFKLNSLTASVDPIKYYEYRALGLPVISTCFGEMRYRKEMPGTFISIKDNDIGTLAEIALHFKDPAISVIQFRRVNSWEKRFADACLIP